MSKRPLSSKIRNVVFTVLSFILSLSLFMMAVCGVLEITVFNESFLFDSMNGSGYFVDRRDEIASTLTNLTYASGLEESFFDDFLDDVLLISDTQKYLDEYYSGNTSVLVDSTAFKQELNEALDEYIEKNNIKEVKESSRNYLVKQAASTYARQLEIPTLGSLAAYASPIKHALPIVMIVLGCVSVAIILVFIFGNKWKHRAAKYICYGVSGAFLSTAAIPAALFISDKVSYIQISSRALYNLIVYGARSMAIALTFCALIYLVIAIGLYFYFRHKYKKIQGDDL